MGDIEFQRKCLGRMKSAAEGGRTVLFVSHNMDAMSALCSRAILLEKGRLTADGPTHEVIARYLPKANRSELTHWRGDAGDDSVRLRSTQAETFDGGPFRTDIGIRIRLVLELIRPVYGLICGIELLSSEQKVMAYSLFDDRTEPPPEELPAGPLALELVIPANSLGAGQFVIRFDVGIHNRRRIIEHEGSLLLQVFNPSGVARRYPTDRARQVLRPDWSWRKIEPQSLEDFHRNERQDGV